MIAIIMIIMIKNYFCYVINYVHVHSSKQFRHTSGNPACFSIVICDIHYFINESLRSLKIQYRDTYFIDRMLTWINQ